MKKVIRKTLILLFWLALWFGLALIVDNPILIATPFQTAGRFLELLGTAGFYRAVAGSLLRIGAGFLAGCCVAVLLAAVSRRFPFLEELLAPVVGLLKAIPVASFVVVLLIWWGSSFLGVAVSFLMVLPNIYINTLEGLKNTDRELLEMAGLFRLPRSSRLFYLYLPALKPFLYSGLKISLGMCWKSGVAAEVIGMPDFSIGGALYLSKVYLDTAGVFAWTATVILLSVLFEKLILRLAGSLLARQPACRRPRSRKPSDGGDLTLKGVCKRFGGQQVLKDVNLVCGQGEITYLRAPSGSGKTTLLRIIAGLTPPDAGEIRVPPGVSMIFQEDRLCMGFNAVKNVELVTGDEKTAREALRRLLDEEALGKPCEALSGGMKRRVALVRAMESDSSVVLLDEPFTGMDADTRARAEEYIRERQNGRTILIATHI